MQQQEAMMIGASGGNQVADCKKQAAGPANNK
jgi:hypothetical protein